MSENNYYVDQYQERKMGSYHRGSGTLSMTRTGNPVPMSSVTMQTSSLGRKLENSDERYFGKENAVKRVSVIFFFEFSCPCFWSPFSHSN